MSDIIKALKSIRLAKSLKQSALGSKLGLPQSHISRIEQGATDPRLSTATDMARLLDHELVLVPKTLLPAVNALLNGDDEPKPMWVPDEEDGDERAIFLKYILGTQSQAY